MVFIIRVKIAAISSGFLVASYDILPSFSSKIVICRSSATLITVLASASGVDISYSLMSHLEFLQSLSIRIGSIRSK